MKISVNFFSSYFQIVVAFSTACVVNAGTRVKRELVDLHNGEFCVDVSEWGEIVYEDVERQKCDSTFAKQCEMKTERVS